MGSIRPNPEGRINKNRKAENKKPDGQTERPNLTIRLKISLPSTSTCNIITNLYLVYQDMLIFTYILTSLQLLLHISDIGPRSFLKNIYIIALIFQHFHFQSSHFLLFSAIFWPFIFIFSVLWFRHPDPDPKHLATLALFIDIYVVCTCELFTM